MTITTVLRSGGDFDIRWVDALRRGLNIWGPHGYRLLVLSDVEEVGVYRVPLEHDWPGWWSKLELFRPGLFDGPVLYMDLDSLPVGPLDELCAYDGPLMALEDFYNSKMVGSGVMVWTPSKATEAIYEEAKERTGWSGRLDRVLAPHVQARIQHRYPGQVVSLKPRHGPDPRKEGAPAGARIVCGHGRPRLSHPAAGWAHDLWRQRAIGQRVPA